MRLISARAWALVVLSAILQVVAFPIAGPLPVWRSIFCWVCLVPLLAALSLPDRSGDRLTIRRSFYLGYLCGFLWYIGNCYWIYQTMYLYGGLPKLVSLGILLLFALYLGLYHALFAMLVGYVRRAGAGLTLPFLVPFLWVAVEFARARVTGFPWDLLGYSQVDNLFLTRLAPIAGVMSISFVVAAANSAIALFFCQPSKSWIPEVTVVLAGVIQVLGVAIPITPVGTRLATAVMMQENLEVGAQGREVRPMSQSEELDRFSDASIHPFLKSGSAWVPAPVSATGEQQINPPTVIIWPEAPSHLRSDETGFRDRMSSLARQANVPLIIGSLGVDFDNSAPRGYYLYDSASLFDSTGVFHGRYDKIHLVPWGEYVPFKRFFAFAQKLTEGVGDMDAGHERTVFAAGDHSYGVFVCYESIFGDEVRQFAKNGAEVLVNISDDGWYGDTGAPWQHLNMARMRAIENDRWVLRATNTGITTAIDPYGRMELQAPRHVRGAFAFHFNFEPAGKLTFYTRYGDWFAWLCVLVSVVGLVTNNLRRGVST